MQSPRPPQRAAQSASLARCRHQARAYTLIEVLVVVGIIAVLVALSVFGFRAVGRISRERLTNNQLENCKSLLAEYELTSNVDTLPAALNATDRWIAPANATTPTALNCTAVAQPRFASGVSNLKERYLRDETARVIAKLRSVPKNRESIEKFQQERITQVKFPIAATAVAVTPPDPPEYATATPTVSGINLLDGNGFPIYFIPGGGLTGLKLGYKGGGDTTSLSNYEQTGQTKRSPDGRPFWVSPGFDGDLSTGDDNIYSFEQ